MNNAEKPNIGSKLQKLVKFSSILAGLGSIILGIVFICTRTARIHVGGFIEDTNRISWRLELFTFIPDIFVDVWTPMVAGVLTILAQFPSSYDLAFVNRTYVHSFLWHFVIAMFANMGYSGGLGVLCATLSFFASLISGVAGILDGVHPKKPVPDLDADSNNMLARA